MPEFTSEGNNYPRNEPPQAVRDAFERKFPPHDRGSIVQIPDSAWLLVTRIQKYEGKITNASRCYYGKNNTIPEDGETKDIADITDKDLVEFPRRDEIGVFINPELQHINGVT